MVTILKRLIVSFSNYVNYGEIHHQAKFDKDIVLKY